MALRFEVARQIASGAPALFRPLGDAAPQGPAAPPLQTVLYQPGLGQSLTAPTRSALGEAVTPQQWSALFLSSPEFMRR